MGFNQSFAGVLGAIAAASLFVATPASATPPAPIEVSVVVDEPSTEVWRRWTTEEGLETFFGRDCEIDPRVDGLLEVWFFPENPPGRRGAEGMRVLAFEPGRRIAFTWDAPPSLPYARSQRTMIDIVFEPVDATHTRVIMRHIGFGDTHDDWALTRAYFSRAWPVVLRRLEYAITQGPVDWDNPAPGLMYSAPPIEQMRAELGLPASARAN